MTGGWGIIFEGLKGKGQTVSPTHPQTQARRQSHATYNEWSNSHACCHVCALVGFLLHTQMDRWGRQAVARFTAGYHSFLVAGMFSDSVMFAIFLVWLPSWYQAISCWPPSRTSDRAHTRARTWHGCLFFCFFYTEEPGGVFIFLYTFFCFYNLSWVHSS